MSIMISERILMICSNKLCYVMLYNVKKSISMLLQYTIYQKIMYKKVLKSNILFSSMSKYTIAELQGTILVLKISNCSSYILK